jgi:glycine/D-amino acid oxidase-like deaminating enzyme
MQFGLPPLTPPRFTGPLPREADVVAIGGGIAGVMTAWFLAARGVRVLLCEKGRIAAEQSSRNWGWIRQQGRDPAELPLMIEANRVWRGLEAEAGADLGLRQTGVLYLALTAKEMAGFEGWMAHARAHRLDTRLLTSSEVRAMLPASAAPWVGGLWTASDMRAEPFVAVPALAAALAGRGAILREGVAVRALDIAAGRVAGVVTEAGRVKAARVVLAGGAWSSRFLGRHGLRLPQLSVRATVAATEPMGSVFDGALTDDAFAIRRRADGGYTLAPGGFHEFMIGPDALRFFRDFWPQIRSGWLKGTRLFPAAPDGYPDAWGTPRHWDEDCESPFERRRILDPQPNLAEIERLRDRFARAFPGAGRPGIARAWAGMIDTLPDVVPVIGPAPLAGLFVLTGLSGHGFGIGPGVGRVMADIVEGRSPGHDLTRFRWERFSDGTPIRPGPSL